MSNLLRKRRPTTTGGTETRPSSPKKQRLIDAAEILLDIVKESADACPPLKSCLGGINALIKHYKEYQDVQEKLRDLIPWLTNLKDNLMTPCTNDNREEVERRERLIRSLEEIEKRSQVLLDKGKGARILDKKRDSQEIVKLVEELRQAILIYQLSQQRSIDNQVTQLASNFNTFLKLDGKTSGVIGKIESALVRLGRFTVAGGSFGDEGESKRRLLLLGALEGIEDELRPILKRSGAVGYKDDDADMHTLCRLAEDVRYAAMEYQFAQQTALYEQSCRLIDSVDLSVLNNCRRAQAAEYRHGNRRGCLKGTRDTVLNEIESWAQDFHRYPVFWLNGLPGTGKSAIAQTFAERLFAEGRLGASFFCSRDFEDRSNLHSIFPTLAFQLARKYQAFRSHFVPLLQSNPDVVHESLNSQMQKLISEPLQKAGISTVIVIDALDECKDDEPSSAILSVLDLFVDDIPEVKFFITSRPEEQIQAGFRLPLLMDSTLAFILHNVDPPLIRKDIRLFLKHELSELARRRKLEGWPTDEHVDLLCDRAAGFFVYAVATVRFLDSSTHLPKRRLDVILKLPGSTAPEGKTWFNPKTTLDSLYASILQTAFGEEDPEVDPKVRTVIGTIVMLVNPLPPLAVAELIGMESEEVMLYLKLIQSLLPLGEDSNQPVKPLHKSLPDFITDPSRCNKRFLVSPDCLHLDLLSNCLRLMNDKLEQDLLSLPEYALNSEVKDLQTRIDSHISTALQYACRSWYNHLTKTSEGNADIIPYLQIFLEEHFLAWLEVLSVLGDVGSASVALEKLMHWLPQVIKDSLLLDITQDCSHFVAKFFEPINVSATHIYHSALELCPRSSIVRKLYYDRCHGITSFPRVVIGTPELWDPTISFVGKDTYKFCTWSPCGQFIAAQTKMMVEIRNQLTFEQLTILQPTKNTSVLMGPLAYSPDGRSLACGFSNAIVIWDIQTGGVAKEIECCQGIVSLVWSLDGKTIAITLGYTHSIPGVEVYDVISGTQLFAEQSELEIDLHLWACEKSFQFMAIALCPGDPTLKISISEIGPTLIKTESFSVKMGVELPSFFAITFSPSTYHIAILGLDTIHVLDIQNSNCLLEESGDFTSSQFSADGSIFAAARSDGIRIWTYAPGGYTLWGESLFRCLPFLSWIKLSLHFSPTSSSILSQCRNILQVQHLHDPSITPKTHHQYAAISNSGCCIATAHESENIVTIIDLHSQVPSQFIDTGVEIRGLVITGNVLLVVGSEKVVAWLLTEDGVVGSEFNNKRAGCSDSIWTVSSPLRRRKLWGFKVEGQVGVIKTDNIFPFIYHTRTGEILEPVHKPQHFSRSRVSLYGPSDCREYYYLRSSNLSQHNTPSKDRWLISPTAMRETGWIMDPGGRHRFWIPVEWREPCENENWHHDITTLFSSIGGQPVIIKF